MSVRTYNPSVRVGNWNEDIQLEEDTLKDFLERRERGELLMQKSSNLKQSMTCKANLSISRDGRVHFGDSAMIINPETRDGSRKACSLSFNSDAVSASMSSSPSSRNTFVITSMDGTQNGESLKYGQPFYLVAGNGMRLFSDRATFQKSAKKSRHNVVSLVDEGTQGHLTEWMVMAFNPQFRMEMEQTDVMANTKVIITHAKTNQNLCVEKDCSIRSPFGCEFEVSSCTCLDSHKAETDVNHWMIVMDVPGDTVKPVEG